LAFYGFLWILDLCFSVIVLSSFVTIQPLAAIQINHLSIFLAQNLRGKRLHIGQLS